MLEQLYEFYGIHQDSIVGLDISSSAVKLLELSKKQEQYQVEHYAIEPLRPGVVVEKDIKDPDEVATALKKAIDSSNISSKRVCLAIPSSLSITRVIQVDGTLKDKEVGDEIILEADRYIPYALEDVNLDYEILGQSSKNPELMDVLLAVSKSENVDMRLDLVLEAGLVPAVVDLETFAIERAFPLIANQLPEDGCRGIVGVVDIGATMMSLNIFDDFKSIYVREQSFGGQQLFNEIQNRYGLTIEEAMLASKYGDLPDDYYPEVLNPFKDTIAQQISRACQFFYSSGDYSAIDFLFLTGGIGAIFGLDEIVSIKNDIRTYIANPFAAMSLNSKIKQNVLTNDAPALMSCCGLALRNFTKR